MKTGTACTRCANAAICPAYDARMLYVFCQGFDEATDGQESSTNVPIATLVKDLDTNADADAPVKVF